MNTLKQQLAARAKAALAAAGLILVGVGEWLVQNPDTATAIEKVVPAPYAQLVPVLLGAVSAVLVHQVPNAALPAPAAVVSEPPTATTALRLQGANGGKFIGDPAH